MNEMSALPGMEADLSLLDQAQIESIRARRIFEVSEEAGPWMDDYWALRAEGWPWRQAVYMIWAGLPRAMRQPKTQGQLAIQVLGLTSDRQIRVWKDKNPAIEVRIRKLTVGALAKARADVMAALVAMAMRQNPRCHADRKMYLEMMGDYVPKQKLTIGPELPDDMSEMDEQELRAMTLSPGGDGE